jgi:S-methylmethionine-dependent homocysteine/selenocysteine methylase
MQHELTLLDGAMGTELRTRGARVPDYRSSIWSASALLHDPDVVAGIHRDYIDAGADIITANNYAVVPNLLVREGLSGRFEDLTRTACRIAKDARSRSARPSVRIAGSLPPLGTTYRPDLVPPDEELYDTYLRIARILVQEVDLAIAETLTTVREAVAAARAAATCDLELWISWNLRLDAPLIRGGESLSSGVRALEQWPVAGYLVNCVPTGLVTPALVELRGATRRPTGAYANACEAATDQESLDTCAVTPLSPEDYALASEHWVAAGASLIGGCCDTGPAYIAALAGRWRRRSS